MSRIHVALPDRGSFLKNVSKFDNIAFGISTKDARTMPRSHRLLIERSFEALLDSGIDYRGRKVGCYMSGNNDTEQSVSPWQRCMTTLIKCIGRV